MAAFDRARLGRLFARFCSERLVGRYGYGDERSVSHLPEMTNYGCNPFLETEADYQVKLGGFLDENLLGDGLTVHAEMNRIYGGEYKAQRPDLTIHSSCAGTPWLTDEDRIGSLRWVIEIKAANIKDPYDGFLRKDNNVLSDITKLEAIGRMYPSVDRCLMFFDEALRVGKPCPKRGSRDVNQQRADELIAKLKEKAAAGAILILSNNSKLCSP